MLRQALDATRTMVESAGDGAKETASESNPEVTRVRRLVHDSESEELLAIVDRQREHAKVITHTAATHSTAIADLIDDLDELFGG